MELDGAAICQPSGEPDLEEVIDLHYAADDAMLNMCYEYAAHPSPLLAARLGQHGTLMVASFSHAVEVISRETPDLRERCSMLAGLMMDNVAWLSDLSDMSGASFEDSPANASLEERATQLIDLRLDSPDEEAFKLHVKEDYFKQVDSVLNRFALGIEEIHDIGISDGSAYSVGERLADVVRRYGKPALGAVAVGAVSFFLGQQFKKR